MEEEVFPVVPSASSVAVINDDLSQSSLGGSLTAITILTNKLPPSFDKFIPTVKPIPNESLHTTSAINSSTTDPLGLKTCITRQRKYDVRKVLQIARELLHMRQLAQEKFVLSATCLEQLIPTQVKSLQGNPSSSLFIFFHCKCKFFLFL